MEHNPEPGTRYLKPNILSYGLCKIKVLSDQDISLEKAEIPRSEERG